MTARAGRRRRAARRRHRAWALVTALGNDVASTWADCVAGTSPASAHDRVVRPVARRLEDRRRGPRLRPERRPRPQGACGGRTATSSSGWSPRARRWTRPACRRGSRASWPSGPASSSAPASAGSRRWSTASRLNAQRGPDRISPFFIPMGIPNVGVGPGRDQLRDDRPELRDRVGLRDRRPRDRRGVGDDPARRRRHDARRRQPRPASSSRSSAASRRCGRCRRATTTRRRLAAVRQGPRRVRHGRGRRRARARGAGARRGARRDASWPSSSATGRPPTHPTSRCPRRAGSARCGPPGGRSRRRASSPTEIDHVNAHATSTPEGDGAELQAIRTLLGEHAPRSRSPPTSRCSATRSAPRARSRRSPRSRRSATACVPPTINLDDPDDERPGPRLVTAGRRPSDVRVALVNSFGFGGQNAALVFRRWEA